MQFDSTRAALAWAWTGVRRIALVAAALLLVVSLIVAMGPAGPAETTGAADDSHVAAAKWHSSSDSDDLPDPIGWLISRGPSWT